MAKRRTRKEKEKAKHQYTISWHPEAKIEDSEASVNRQNKKATQAPSDSIRNNKNAEILAKDDGVAKSKHDIIKSVLLAALIIGLEIVLYLAWQA